MALPMLYSRRKRLASKTGDDVYQYETMSPKLRQQLIFMFASWDERHRQYGSFHPIFKDAVSAMREELGVACLCSRYARDCDDEFQMWFQEEQNIGIFSMV